LQTAAYQDLQNNADAAAAAMAQVDINPNRLAYPEFLQQCASAREFSNHVAGLYSAGELGGHGHGRIGDAEAIVDEWKIKNENAKAVCFQAKFLEADTTARGGCYNKGVHQKHSLVFEKNTHVLEVLKPTSTADRVVVYLDMLLLSAQISNAQGIPIGYRVQAGQAKTLFTYATSGSNNWAHFDVDGDACCVLTIVGLLQFGMIPRHPQKGVKRKYANWGYDASGLFRTILYHVNHI